MFSYYGAKSKIASRYPAPKYAQIMEPFAGAARYSMLYADHEVWLNDAYCVIADIWNYLIHATPEQINALPDMQQGDDVRLLNLPPAERYLMGFTVNSGVPYPHNIVTPWAASKREIPKLKKRVLEYLPLIRHWKVTCLDYTEMPDVEATWFIDPPYSNGGSRYVKNHMDYGQLAEWCRSRRGQVIVCENGEADWLPFRHLVSVYGQKKHTKELIWTNGDEDG